MQEKGMGAGPDSVSCRLKCGGTSVRRLFGMQPSVRRKKHHQDIKQLIGFLISSLISPSSTEMRWMNTSASSGGPFETQQIRLEPCLSCRTRKPWTRTGGKEGRSIFSRTSTPSTSPMLNDDNNKP